MKESGTVSHRMKTSELTHLQILKLLFKKKKENDNINNWGGHKLKVG